MMLFWKLRCEIDVGASSCEADVVVLRPSTSAAGPRRSCLNPGKDPLRLHVSLRRDYLDTNKYVASQHELSKGCTCTTSL